MVDVHKVVDGLDTPGVFKAVTKQIHALFAEFPTFADEIAKIVAAGNQVRIVRDGLTQLATGAVKVGVIFDTMAEESRQMMAR